MLAVKEALVRSWWVVDADIEGFFDNVDHEILRGLVRRRISDRRVLKLIDQWLRAGVLIDGQRHKTRGGVPQGGVISPLLANIRSIGGGVIVTWASGNSIATATISWRSAAAVRRRSRYAISSRGFWGD